MRGNVLHLPAFFVLLFTVIETLKISVVIEIVDAPGVVIQRNVDAVPQFLKPGVSRLKGVLLAAVFTGSSHIELGRVETVAFLALLVREEEVGK